MRSWLLAGLLAGLASLAGGAVAEGYRFEDVGRLSCEQLYPVILEGQAKKDPQADYTAAQLVVRAICYRRDYGAYARLLKKAADGGVEGAMRDLGYAYALAEGVEQDYAQAGAWLHRGGLDPAHEHDDYTFGYDYAVEHLVRRANHAPTRIWLDKTHIYDMTVSVTGTAVEPRVRLSAGQDADAESDKLAVQLHETMTDAIARARRELARPDPARLDGKPYVGAWRLRMLSSREETPFVKDIEQSLPR